MSSMIVPLRAVVLAMVVTCSVSVLGAEKKPLATPAPAEVDPAAGSVLDAQSAFYQSLKSFSVKVTFEGRNGASVTPQFKSESAITVQKPRQFSAVVKTDGESTTLVSDGTAMFIFEPAKKTYFKTAAPPSPSLLLGRFAPGLSNLLAANPKAEMMQGVSKVTLAGEEKLGATLCQRLHFTQKSGEVEAWIEKGPKPLLRRLTMASADGSENRMEVRFDDWQLDPKLDAQRFAFTPPKDAKEIHPEQEAAKERAAAAKVPPIKFVPGAKLAEDDRKIFHAWAERVLIAPFKTRLKGDPWDDAVLSFVTQAVDDLAATNDNSEADALAASGKDFIANGCNDPLVRYLTARIAYRVHDDYRPARATFMQLIKEMEADSTWPRALLCCIGKDLATVGARGNFPAAPVDKQVIAWTKVALTDGSFRKEDDVAFLQQQIGLQWRAAFERNFKVLGEAYATADLADWVQRTLRGFVEVKLAWEARGSGYAETVTEAAWKGYGEHLAKAKTDLRQAWKLRPDRPEAATKMIGVVMDGADEDGEDVRLWFDRATAAQFDYREAYTSILWSYRPRWGGSHELMLNFGRACRDTRRYDTDTPSIFMDAIHDAISEYDDWREFYSDHPEITREIEDYYRAALAEPSRSKYRRYWHSMLAVYAWMGGDYKVAAASLKELDDKLNGTAIRTLRTRHSDSAQMIADVALHTGQGAAEFAKAEVLLEKKDYPAARASYEATAKVAVAKALPVIRSRMALVDFETAFAGGDWVKLTPAPGLLDWSVRGGKWEVDSDGTLINHGTDASGMVVFKGRVGAEVEVRGEFEIIALDNCCRTLGVALGYQLPTSSSGGQPNRWVNCTVQQGGRSKPVAAIFERYYKSEIPYKPIALKPINEFLVRAHAGKLTYQVNGQAFFEEQAPPKNTKITDDGLIGFGALRFCGKNTTKIRKIEVRRLPAKL